MLDEVYRVDDPRLVGVVLDVKPRVIAGESRLEKIKRMLAEVLNSELTDFDAVYMLTNEQSDGVPERIGPGLAKLANWRAPSTFKAHFAFQHTMNMVGEAEHEPKHVLYITDQFQPIQACHLIQSLDLAVRERYDCQVAFINVSGKHSPELDKVVAKHANARAYHISLLDLFPAVVGEFLNKETDDDAEPEYTEENLESEDA